MTWHSARILFRSTVDGIEKPDALCEESIRVFRAADSDEASEKAVKMGRSAEHEYKNEDGQIVRWNFINVVEIQDLAEDELTEGTEVYSRLFRADVMG